MTYEEYLSDGTPVNNQGELRFELCPSCSDDKSHFYYNVNRGLGNCKKCNYSPNKKKLIKDLELNEYSKQPFIERIVDGLKGLEGVSDDDGDTFTMPKAVSLPSDAFPAYHSNVALRYLRKRGVTVKEIVEHDLRYCQSGKYAGRIVVPVYDHDGNVFGFSARGIFRWSSEPKYRFPKGFKKSWCLYGLSDIQPGCENIVVVEGVFDKLRGGEDYVASFGKTLSEMQLHLLLSFRPKSVSVMFDSDAYDESLKAAVMLSYYVPVKIIQLPEGKDPGSLSRRVLWSLNKQAYFYKTVEWSVEGME